jgi:hypothetical protein
MQAFSDPVAGAEELPADAGALTGAELLVGPAGGALLFVEPDLLPHAVRTRAKAASPESAMPIRFRGKVIIPSISGTDVPVFVTLPTPYPRGRWTQ